MYNETLTKSAHAAGQNINTNIKELAPIIFYSGKNDEMEIHLKELQSGELIINSLTNHIIKVKEVMLQDTDEKLNWRQDEYGLKISLPAGSETNKETSSRVIKVLL